ncbi:MAG: hypothetical protein K940chlam5_01643, partial [Candidatus Anoxychlamydiales bacterium]|nr:hypothetical protein [Candidatus Anoxychlamydiales bacterium]
SSSFENLVYLHLRKEDYENIYYYKTKTGKEVDFVTQQANGKIKLYQACVTLNNEKTKNREISAIVDAAKELNLNEAFIITSDESEVIELSSLKIHVIPYWQWVLPN